MTLYFSKIIYSNSLNKCIFGLNFLALHKMFLGQNLESTGSRLRAQRCQLEHEALGCRTQLAAPKSQGAHSSWRDPLSPLPPPPGEMPRGPRGGHSWDRAPRPVQKQWGPAWWQQKETAEQGRKDGYFLPTLLERGKFATGLETRAQRGSADPRELSSKRFLDGTGALEIRGFKNSEVKSHFCYSAM